MGHTHLLRAAALVAALGAMPVVGTSTSSSAAPGRTDAATRISYDGIGKYRIGQTVRVRAVPVFYPHCTANQLVRKSVWMVGRPLDRTTARITALSATSPAYRTASGMRVGVSLATLRKTYGTQRLKVQPTELGSGQVATLVKGKRALTFSLDTKGLVTQIKVSSAADRGEDEGCA